MCATRASTLQRWPDLAEHSWAWKSYHCALACFACLLLLAGAALGTGVSAANALGCLALLLSTLLGGFLLSRARMPAAVRWAANLSYVR